LAGPSGSEIPLVETVRVRLTCATPEIVGVPLAGVPGGVSSSVTSTTIGSMVMPL